MHAVQGDQQVVGERLVRLQVTAHLELLQDRVERWIEVFRRQRVKQVAAVRITRRLVCTKQAGGIGAPVRAAGVPAALQKRTGLVEEDDAGGPRPIRQAIDAVLAATMLG